MDFSVVTTPVPFINDSEGIIRIGNTRVTLDTVINSFKNGSTCEEIVYQYPVLKLADVYTAISFYLNNQETIEEYLDKHEQIAENIQSIIKKHFDIKEIRERLSVSRSRKK